jgi:hypothetical protein
MNCFHRILTKVIGENQSYTPKDIILEQMHEPRPLPMGREEFMKWSYRIISGALLPKDPNESEEVFHESIRYALANMLLHLGPTESHKPDVFFIHSLRKIAINQVADTLRKESFEKRKSILAELEREKEEIQCPILEVGGEEHA